MIKLIAFGSSVHQLMPLIVSYIKTELKLTADEIDWSSHGTDKVLVTPKVFQEQEEELAKVCSDIIFRLIKSGLNIDIEYRVFKDFPGVKLMYLDSYKVLPPCSEEWREEVISINK
jgi:hypothetical protein